MATKLRNMKITEISLVDRGANEGARVVLTKRADTSSEPGAISFTQDAGGAVAFGKQKMTTTDIGNRAMLTLDRLADELRKREPSLTQEQAFAKVYTDPANIKLVKAERAANGFRTEAGATQAPPIAKTVGPEESGEAYNYIMRQAQEAHEADPSQSVAQHFAKIYCAKDALGLALRKWERDESGIAKDYPATIEKKAYPPVARMEPEIEQNMAMDKLKALAAECRRQHPFLTPEQAFARIYADPSNRELVRVERAAAHDRFEYHAPRANIDVGRQ